MKVLKYSEDSLKDSLSNDYTSSSSVSNKNHFQYLKNYLSSGGLDAATIVVEEDYISKDFLEDYTTYYAQCFRQYPKFCKRVHFFGEHFTEEEFKVALLYEKADSIFWKSYLGFVLVKPIPSTIIGYTVLKTYSGGKNFDLRNFWGTRTYKIHLFGKELELDSLAFQEQDSILAACATTAIWSMLNKASLDHHTVLKSPSHITKDADNTSLDGSRLFPNRGLNILQICQAILNSGLVTEVKKPDFDVLDNNGQLIGRCISRLYLNKIINAYAPIGIPIILVISVPSGGVHGLHAITVSGFKQSAPSHIPPKSQVSWLADNIQKLYAHDDQWGPFARVSHLNDSDFETPWTTHDPLRRASHVTNIIVSLYPKVRIPYEDIQAVVLGLDTILTLFFQQKVVADLVWDIKINFSQSFKAEVLASTLPDTKKMDIIKQSMPKYIWIATCYIDGEKVFDFTFDATDVSHGMIGTNVLVYFDDLIQDLKDYLEQNRSILITLFYKSPREEYYDYFISQLEMS